MSGKKRGQRTESTLPFFEGFFMDLESLLLAVLVIPVPESK